MTKEELANIKKILPMPFAGSENIDECGIATNDSYAQDYMTDQRGYMSPFYDFHSYEIPYVAPADDPENPPRAKELFSRQYLNALIKYFTSTQFYEQCGGIINPNRKTLPTWSNPDFPNLRDWFGNPKDWAEDAIVPVVYEGTLYFIRSLQDYNNVYWGDLTLSEILAGTNKWKACLQQNAPNIPKLIDYSNSYASIMAEFDNTFYITVNDSYHWTKISSGQFSGDGNVIVESNNAIAARNTTESSTGFIRVCLVTGIGDDIQNIQPSPTPSPERGSSIQLFLCNYDPNTDGNVFMNNYIPVQKDYYWSMWRWSEDFIGNTNPILFDGKIKVKFTPNRNE